MADISVRQLRNEVSAVLRRVEAGERLRVTVNGRPVAELVPLGSKPRSVTWEEFQTWPKADRGLYDLLREELSETTDDIRDPWADRDS